MRYIKLLNNNPINYTMEQLFSENPEALIYNKSQLPSNSMLEKYNIYPLITTTPPTVNREDKIAVEGTPEFIDGEWQQTWIVRDLTQTELQQKIKKFKDGIHYSEQGKKVQTSYANPDKINSRSKVCQDCSELGKKNKICKKTGQLVDIKVCYIDEVCPLNKW